MRKYASRRLLALSEGEIGALMTAMRQLGVGSQGGAEALAIFRKLIHDEWVAGSLSAPLARIKVDERKCFGMIEWNAARKAAANFLPKHAAVAVWKHRSLSHVEQKNLPPMPKDRGAEQGDVDGPLECGLALGMVAAETRTRVAAQQAAGNLPWFGVDDPSEVQGLQTYSAERMQKISNFPLGGPEKLTGADDLRHALQRHEDLLDLWYMDDGDILCHPVLVPSFLHEFL